MQDGNCAGGEALGHLAVTLDTALTVAEQLGQGRDAGCVADDHEHGRPGQVAHEQGLRQQVGHHAQAQDPADQAPEADDEREGSGQCRQPAIADHQ